MALSFNCGQYEKAFDSRRLQNWEQRHKHRRRPLTKGGYTQIISNDRGHLLPSLPRSARSPWGTFVGTWDLPKKLPGNKQTDPTARSADAHIRYTGAKAEADDVIYGRNKMRRAKAGQPIEAMPTHCSDIPPPAPSGRSGAMNPIVKGTPPRSGPVNRVCSPNMAAAQPPLDLYTANNAPAVEETINQELICSPQPNLANHCMPRTPNYCSPLPPLPGSAHASRRNTPPQMTTPFQEQMMYPVV